jgi:hypothetical protein
MAVVAEFKRANDLTIMAGDQDDVISRLSVEELSRVCIGKECTDSFLGVKGGNVSLEGPYHQV